MRSGGPSADRNALARRLATIAFALLAAGCASLEPPTDPAAGPQPAVRIESAPPSSAAGQPGAVLARSGRMLVYRPGAADTLESIARERLGDASRAWEIAALNGAREARPGVPLALPLRPVRPHGVHPDGYQLVPILTYHRIGPRPQRMTVTPAAFEAQLEYLRRNGYPVVPLSALEEFLAGRRALPPRAVVLSFDDGHGSVHRYGFPLLQRFGMTATLFLYTDYLGGGSALTWAQIREMGDSGLVALEGHSKTHANLVERLNGESDGAYRDRIDLELRQPREVIARNTGRHIRHFAYPYGDADSFVMERLVAAGHALGLTVLRGGNAFFADPRALRRTMIFGEHDIDAFRARLQVLQPMELR